MFPCRAHAQESHMCDRLRIRRDPVMLLVRQMSHLALKTSQNPLHKRQLLVRPSMVDNHQGLSARRHRRSMHTMARNDVHILGQVLLKRCNLGRLDRRLTRYNRTDLCS